MNTADARARSDILKAVAHPIRILMLDALSRGDRCVNELLSVARVDQSTISRHLAHLKRAGIVTERREGTKIYHHLSCPCMLQAVDCSMQVIASVQRRTTAARKVPRGA